MVRLVTDLKVNELRKVLIQAEKTIQASNAKEEEDKKRRIGNIASLRKKALIGEVSDWIENNDGDIDTYDFTDFAFDGTEIAEILKSSDYLPISTWQGAKMTDEKTITKFLNENDKVNEMVKTCSEEGHEVINIETTMKRLASVALLIRIAYYGSDLTEAQTIVQTIMTRYQSLINNSKMMLKEFSMKSKVAIQNVQEAAYMIMQFEDYKEAVKSLYENRCLCEVMRDKADTILDNVDVLIELTNNAATKSINSRETSEKQKEEFKKLQNEMKAEQVRENERKKLKEQAVRKAEQEAEEYKERAKVAKDGELAKNIIGTLLVLPAVFGAAKDSGESLEIMKMQMKRQEAADAARAEMCEANAKVEELAEKLKYVLKDTNDIGVTINMLCIAIQVLGIVKTAFENIKMFWSEQKHTLDILLDCGAKAVDQAKSMAAGDSDPIFLKLERSVNQSMISWINLYLLNREGLKRSEEASKEIDNAMCDLGGIRNMETMTIREKQDMTHREYSRWRMNYGASAPKSPTVEIENYF